MPLIIQPEQRDALYASITARLTGIGDIYVAVAVEDFDTADRLSSEFADYLRLLHDDLGWGDSADGPIELKSPLDVLERSLKRLKERAEIEWGEEARERAELEGQEVEVRLVTETCDQLLAQIG